ncbi:hypothetical protein SAMN05421858_3120 [Haladaptatus litoreus]|uniref:Uncharacterized protein n=1 Tax=Haladaptatus litoreus TaxID=553468 RepID=A0A1N7CMZ6_9EURY|nr:hypothetical protein [Haladaptatus litoreus]SIR65009.1 hypothetical protein SAMN05421858_3120 [Haladaptatus litoreus]
MLEDIEVLVLDLLAFGSLLTDVDELRILFRALDLVRSSVKLLARDIDGVVSDRRHGHMVCPPFPLISGVV